MEVINDNGNSQNQNNINQESKRVVAGVLAILLGSLGIHKFILGYTKEGVIQLVISFISCGFLGLIGLIEGIIYLTKSDEEFIEIYQNNQKPWF
ncbi:MAG: hypothetical protein COA67_04740 [Lutibacter sp.]|nr:MAG: hypothetical protein COA67_04740 [Lutibacter sp.]